MGSDHRGGGGAGGGGVRRCGIATYVVKLLVARPSMLCPVYGTRIGAYAATIMKSNQKYRLACM